MILVSFTKIHKGIKVTNFGHSCHIHVLSHPCANFHNIKHFLFKKLKKDYLDIYLEKNVEIEILIVGFEQKKLV